MAEWVGNFDWILPVDTRRWSPELDRCTSTTSGELLPSLSVTFFHTIYHQAIAKDGIIPFIQPFAVSSSRGEPTRALILTMCICECGILLGELWSYNLFLIAVSVQTSNTLLRPIINFYFFIILSFFFCCPPSLKQQYDKQETLIYWHHCCPCSSSCAMALLISPVPYRLYCVHPTGVHASSSIIGEWSIYLWIIFLASPRFLCLERPYFSCVRGWTFYVFTRCLGARGIGKNKHERVNIKLNSPKMPKMATVNGENKNVFGDVMSTKVCWCFIASPADGPNSVTGFCDFVFKQTLKKILSHLLWFSTFFKWKL